MLHIDYYVKCTSTRDAGDLTISKSLGCLKDVLVKLHVAFSCKEIEVEG
jgi:hypothetical protein